MAICVWSCTVQHVRGHSFDFMDQSWAYVFLRYLFLGLFASMGCAGNFGIIVGLFFIVISILAFWVTLTTGGESKTNLDLHFLICQILIFILV